MPSPYGPPAYVTNQSGEILGNAISDAASTFVQRRRQKKQDEEQSLRNEAELYGQGVRSGKVPQEYRTDTIPTPSFTAPSSAALAQQLRMAPSAMVTTSADGAHVLPAMSTTAPRTDPLAATQPQVTPSRADFAAAIQNAPSSRSPATSTAAAAATDQSATASDGRDQATTHPGAFDITSRQFGGSPVQLATAAAHTQPAGQPGAPGGGSVTFQVPTDTGRYAPLDANHYIDTTMTPAAERARERAQELEIANRNRFDQAAFAAALRGDAAAAHDTRMDDRATAHDAAVTARGEAHDTRTAASGIARVDEAAKTRAKRFARFQSEDGRYWMNDPSDPEAPPMAIMGPDGRQMKGPVQTEIVADPSNPDAPGIITPKGLAIGSRAGSARPAGGGLSGSASVRGFGQGGVFGAGSGIGSVNEMQTVAPQLKEAEDRIGTGDISLNGWDTFQQGLIAHAKANQGFIDSGVANALIQHLAETNPDLVDYATLKLAWVTADLNLSRGSSDERGRLLTITDGLDLPVGAMNPQARTRYIARMQQRRDARLSGLSSAGEAAKVMLKRVTDGSGGPGAAPGAKPAAASGHSTVSDDDFKRAWNAGMRSDVEITEWVRKHAGGRP